MDAQALVVRAASIKSQVRELTTERARLAPQAINGALAGPYARQRIAAIDTARSQLMLELETVEAALNSPQFKHQSLVARLDTAFERKLPRYRAGLVLMLAERYQTLAYQDNLANSGIDVASLPLMIASDLTEATRVRDDLASWHRTKHMLDSTHQAEPLDEKEARMEAELACRERHAQQLVNSTTLPAIPKELQAKLGKQPQINTPLGAKSILRR